MEEKLPIILPKNGVFGALYALLDTGGRKGIKFSEVLLNEYGIAVVPGEPFYGGPVSSIRLSLVATPWVTGDEEWVGNVKALKRALRKMNLY
jgi:aspartate/methionine/tyrosine aminotransferase